MEADWSVEIGEDVPVIAVPWQEEPACGSSEAARRFIDLRQHPEDIRLIEEVTSTPALAAALLKLNAVESPVFTSKCDNWLLSQEDIDPYEFDASAQEARAGMACYIDLVLREQIKATSFALHETWLRQMVTALRKIPLAQSRVELVMRPAIFTEAASEGFAVTLYVSACAATLQGAENIFGIALGDVVNATINEVLTMGE